VRLPAIERLPQCQQSDHTADTINAVYAQFQLFFTLEQFIVVLQQFIQQQQFVFEQFQQ
jgi:hypothetical protein